MKKKSGPNKLPPRKGTITVKKSKYHSARYERLLSTDSAKKFEEFGNRVRNQELKWVCYLVENGIGSHYYLLLKKKK